MITKNISNLKIQKLTQEQYDRAFENGTLDDESIYLTPTEIKDYALKEDLKTKADLIDGKVPLSQLPDDIGGGGGGPQIQSDYNQNDDTQMDYIKNRPFYTLPPEHNLDFTPYRKKAAITWDGVILPNHPKVSLEMDGTILTFYKATDDFITSQDILNDHAVYQFFPEVLEEMGEEGMEVKNYLMIFPLSSDILPQIVFFEDTDMLIGMMALSFNIDGTITVPGAGITLEVPSVGTYFLYDVDGNMIAPGYLTAIEGEIKSDPEDEELKNDPNITITKDIFGEGSTLILEKVSNNFIPEEKLIGSLFGMNMVSWNPDDIGEGSVAMDAILSEVLLSEMVSIAKGDDGESYALLMGGQIPLFGSIKSTSTTIKGLLIAGPGTYFCYVDMNKLSQGLEMWVDKFITPETVFLIDSKFIPQKTFVPDYDEMDPSSDSYIANRLYYSRNYYNYYNGDITDTSLCVAPNEDGTIFYQWGYELDSDFDNPERYDKGYLDAIVKNLSWRNLSIEPNSKSWNITSSNSDSVLYVYNWDTSSYLEYFGFTNQCIFAYIALEDNITTKVSIPWSNDYETITFPKKGVYYLYSIKDIDNHIYLYLIDLYREKKNILVRTTNEVSSYEDNTPISSYGVYKALGNRYSFNVIDSISYGNYNPISSHGVSDGLRNINNYITSYADSDYTYYRYRGTKLVNYNTTPNENGTIVWRYE